MTMGLLTPNTQKDLPTSRDDARARYEYCAQEGVDGEHQPLVEPRPGPTGDTAGRVRRLCGCAPVHAQDARRVSHAFMGQDGGPTISPPPPPRSAGAVSFEFEDRVAFAAHFAFWAGLFVSFVWPGRLAERLRPHFFSSFGKHAMSSSSSSSSSYPTPPGSPVFAHKLIGSSSHSQKEKDQQQQQQQQQVLIAAMASQKILKKLGSAFWDAFVGSSSPSSSSATGLSSAYTTNNSSSGNWDTDKVKRILEGKTVLRVVDVDSLHPSPVAVSVSSASTVTASEKVQCEKKVCELLEESMRSLTIGKKG